MNASYWLFAATVLVFLTWTIKSVIDKPSVHNVISSIIMPMIFLCGVHKFRSDYSRLEESVGSLSSDEQNMLELEAMKQLTLYGFIFLTVAILVAVLTVILIYLSDDDEYGWLSAHAGFGIAKWLPLAGVAYCCGVVMVSTNQLVLENQTTPATDAQVVSDAPYEGMA